MLSSEKNDNIKPLIEKDEAAVGDTVLHDGPAHGAEEGDAVLADVGGVEVPEQGGVLAACSILANLISLQPVQPGCTMMWKMWSSSHLVVKM